MTPRAGLILTAAFAYALSLAESWWVRNLRPGWACRCRMFFGHGKGWRWWTR